MPPVSSRPCEALQPCLCVTPDRQAGGAWLVLGFWLDQLVAEDMANRTCVGVRAVGAAGLGPVRSLAKPVVAGIVMARLVVAPARLPGETSRVEPVHGGVGVPAWGGGSQRRSGE